MKARTEAGDVVTDIVLRTFRLNGQFLAAAERIARGVGLTAAWWQVLGSVLDKPTTVADIARHMGLTRQAVQRIADLLVEREMAEYADNPAHRRAKLLRPTEKGWDAIRGLRPDQNAWANEITESFTADELRQALDVIERLIKATAE